MARLGGVACQGDPKAETPPFSQARPRPLLGAHSRIMTGKFLRKFGLVTPRRTGTSEVEIVRSVGPQADPPRELAGFLLGVTVAVCVYRLVWGSVCPLSAQSKLGQPARHGQSCSDHSGSWQAGVPAQHKR